MPAPRDPLQSLAAIEAAVTPEAVYALLEDAAARQGFDRYVLFTTPATQEEAVEQVYRVQGDWFGPGVGVDAETYLRQCPITRNFWQTEDAFYWSKRGEGDGGRYRVVARPRGEGLHGLQVPVFGRAGLIGGISLGGERIDASPAARITMVAIAQAAFRRVHALLRAGAAMPDAGLSSREREVLRWIAAGRRQAEIAGILGLSGRTIENHLRRIRIRLGVATTAQAVRIALQQGQLDA